MPRQIKQDSDFKSRLLKLIPTEIVAAYMAVVGLIPANQGKWGTFGVSLFLLILTPFYLSKVQGVKNILQIIMCTLSFIVWIYSLGGGPFLYWDLYQSWIASAALVLWTTLVPVFIKTSPK